MMIRKEQKGFTLLEMLVVSAIFVMALTSMVSIFVQTNRAQKSLANSEKLQADTRYVVELVTREVRNNRIDYDFYDGSSGKDLDDQPVNYLALRDGDDEQIIFHYDNNNMKICRDISVAINCANDNYFDITPDDISVISMKFLISPNINPFSVYAAGRPDLQPLITLALTTQSLTGSADGPDWIRYQTAISSRYYIR
jgi:prepilin-type N-terminal cleavage/methylation domain-containing protein